MRCAAVAALRSGHAVHTLCRALGVAPSQYYAWRRRVDRTSDAALSDDATLAAHLRAVHAASDGTYGRPRLTRELRARGLRVGERRVARLQRELGLWGGRRAAWRRAGDRRARQRGANAVAPNRLARDFAIGRLNARWASDTTWIPTREGPLALAVVLDLGSRRVVGWATGPRCTGQLTLRALRRALAARRPAAGLLHHADQGEEYMARGYRAALAEAGVALSMSRVGNCWDNAVVESFFATLKAERVPATPGGFATRSLAETALFHYIEVFYNRQRQHSTLGYLSPAHYEAALTT